MASGPFFYKRKSDKSSNIQASPVRSLSGHAIEPVVPTWPYEIIFGFQVSHICLAASRALLRFGDLKAVIYLQSAF